MCRLLLPMLVAQSQGGECLESKPHPLPAGLCPDSWGSCEELARAVLPWHPGSGVGRPGLFLSSRTFSLPPESGAGSGPPPTRTPAV